MSDVGDCTLQMPPPDSHEVLNGLGPSLILMMVSGPDPGTCDVGFAPPRSKRYGRRKDHAAMDLERAKIAAMDLR